MTEGRAFRVGVIFGGRSGEHQVSLNSARNVMDALIQAGHDVVPLGITQHGRWLTQGDPFAQLIDNERSGNESNGSKTDDGRDLTAESSGDWALLPQASDGASLPAIDVIFPVLHGTYGEDGTIQGLLEMANLPYVGCGVLASATAMDKVIAKALFAQAGLPQMPYEMVLRRTWQTSPETVLEKLEDTLGYPLFVKPANLGSSVGISQADDRDELRGALDLACHYDSKLVVEATTPNVREIEVSVLGNDDPVASIPGEIVPGNKFYDYAAKYLDDNSDLLIPAPLTEEQVAHIQAMAIEAFQAVDGSGLARVDFLMNGQTGDLYLNEVNTLPGFTRISMYPKLWEASGISYPALVDKLLDLALERFEDRQQNSTVFDL